MKKKTSATDSKPAKKESDHVDGALHEGETSLETRHRNLVYEKQLYQIELEMQNKELTQAQAALEESRAKYCDLFDLAPIGYIIFDEKGIIREANLTFAKKMEVERAFLIEKPFLVHIRTEDRDTFYSHLKWLVREQSPQTCEVRLITGRGKEFLALMESVYTADARGEMLCRTAISDISAERNTVNIIDAVDVGIILLDMTGRVISVNPALEKISGHGRDAMRGDDIHTLVRRLVRDSDRGRVEQTMNAALEGRSTDPSSFWLISPSGREVLVSAHISFVRDRKGRASQVIITLQDITALMKMDQELRENNELLMHAEKLAAIGQMTSGIAHELNQPLNHLSIIVEILESIVRKGKSSAKELLLELAIARENISRAADIINGLREFSRKDTHEPVAIDIRQSINNSVRIMDRSLSESSIQLRIDIPSCPVVAVASVNSLSQVMVNLLSNARDSLEQCSDRRKKIIDLTVRGEEKTVAVSLADNGMGVAEKHLPYIFDPFYTTKDSHKGTGLGLSISQKIIEKFGGTLRAESREDLGTTMTITLQRAPALSGKVRVLDEMKAP